MLNRARDSLPPQVFEKSRFVIPKADVFTEGNKTWISNWSPILKDLNRDKDYDHLAKYLAGVLATSATEERGRLLLQGKFKSFLINRHLNDYVKTYVICTECGKPDTKLTREGRILIRICEACGARVAVK